VVAPVLVVSGVLAEKKENQSVKEKKKKNQQKKKRKNKNNGPPDLSFFQISYFSSSYSRSLLLPKLSLF
jgi:hypothetical protein